MIVLLANGEISHITSNENFKVIVTEICSSALFRFFSTTPYTQGQSSMVNFPLLNTLFDDLAHFFTVCMFRSKPQRKKENPKGSTKKKKKNAKTEKFVHSLPCQQTIQKLSHFVFATIVNSEGKHAAFFFFFYSITILNCINYP